MTSFGDASTESAEAVRIDHVLVGGPKLESGVERVERLTGVRPEYGGAHPDLGTHNALLSLGDDRYLEVIAPRPGEDVAGALDFLTRLDRPEPVGWAVATSDASRTAERLRAAGHATTSIRAASRSRPDGVRLAWKMFLLEGLGLHGPPFFIEWNPSSVHPAQSAPRGCSLESLSLVHPEADRLRSVVRILGLDVTVTFGPRSTLSIRLNSPRGSVVLTSGGEE